MSEDQVAIRVDNVFKAFKLPHERHSSFKSVLINVLRRKRGYERQQVLKQVSFEIKKGEFFGVVGRNGSGKSTLLKLLADIYVPDKGYIQVNGSLTPFIELGVGFNPELTGRENIFLNGALLGFDHKKVESIYDSIVDFAELHRFMDQKLKNYSSGMQVRLAFSIAIQAKTDILVLDEVLAVGDADFQRKCLQYFTQLKKGGQTVVFVSHDMESVKQYCDRAVFIDNGEVKAIGKPVDIVPQYMSTFVEAKREQLNSLPFGISKAVSIDESVVQITKVWLEDEHGKATKSLAKNASHFFVKLKLKALKDAPGVIPGVIVSNTVGDFVIASNFKWADFTKNSDVVKGKTYEVTFKLLNVFEQGQYQVSVNVVSREFDTFLAWKNEACTLYADKAHQTGAMVNPKYEVGIAEL